MKKNLLKNLSMTLVALATVVVVAMGVEKDVKAAYTPTTPAETELINLVQDNENNMITELEGTQWSLHDVFFEGLTFQEFLDCITDPERGNNTVSYSNKIWTITDSTPSHNVTTLEAHVDADNYIAEVICTFPDGDVWTFNNTEPKPDPTPTPDPTPSPAKDVPAEVKEVQNILKDADDNEIATGFKGDKNVEAKIAVNKIYSIGQEKIIAAILDNKEVTLAGLKVSPEVLRTNEFAQRIFINQVLEYLGVAHRVVFLDDGVVAYVNKDGSLSYIKLAY